MRNTRRSENVTHFQRTEHDALKALHLAAGAGHAELCKVLLESGLSEVA